MHNFCHNIKNEKIRTGLFVSCLSKKLEKVCLLYMCTVISRCLQMQSVINLFMYSVLCVCHPWGRIIWEIQILNVRFANPSRTFNSFNFCMTPSSLHCFILLFVISSDLALLFESYLIWWNININVAEDFLSLKGSSQVLGLKYLNREVFLSLSKVGQTFPALIHLL